MFLIANIMLCFFSLSLVWANEIGGKEQWLVQGKDLQEVRLNEIVDQTPPGSILIVSEIHDYVPHSDNQKLILETLLAQPNLEKKISVGLEFLSFTKQTAVDSFLAGNLNEEEFLKNVGWGGNRFDLYKEQILFTKKSFGKTRALNIPMSLAKQISKNGFTEGLSEVERDLLPPNFSLGNDRYRRRFEEYMNGGHDPLLMLWPLQFKFGAVSGTPQDFMDRMFAAQSAWDDAMAYQACSFIKNQPSQVLVVIVGDFHVIYGGGLPDRLKDRGCPNVKVISQVVVDSFDDVTKKSLLPEEGVSRADWIWAVKE